MKLRRWDIVFVPSDESDPVGHPAVVLSPDEITDSLHHFRLNVLVGTKRVPAATVLSHQVVLNGADGLEFQTVINCSMIFVVRKAKILRRVGVVSLHRRTEIQRKVRSSLGLG